MKVLIIVCLVAMVYGQFQLPNGHNMKQQVDLAFGKLDHNPKDGMVSLDEFELIIYRDDVNNDSCVTKTEYMDASRAPDEISSKIFVEFEKDGDSCLDIADMINEYHIIDKDHNGQVSLHEFEHYFTNLMHHLFHGHSGSHGGHNIVG